MDSSPFDQNASAPVNGLTALPRTAALAPSLTRDDAQSAEIAPVQHRSRDSDITSIIGVASRRVAALPLAAPPIIRPPDPSHREVRLDPRTHDVVRGPLTGPRALPECLRPSECFRPTRPARNTRTRRDGAARYAFKSTTDVQSERPNPSRANGNFVMTKREVVPPVRGVRGLPAGGRLRAANRACGEAPALTATAWRRRRRRCPPPRRPGRRADRATRRAPSGRSPTRRR